MKTVRIVSTALCVFVLSTLTSVVSASADDDVLDALVVGDHIVGGTYSVPWATVEAPVDVEVDYLGVRLHSDELTDTRNIVWGSVTARVSVSYVETSCGDSVATEREIGTTLDGPTFGPLDVHPITVGAVQAGGTQPSCGDGPHPDPSQERTCGQPPRSEEADGRGRACPPSDPSDGQSSGRTNRGATSGSATEEAENGE